MRNAKVVDARGEVVLDLGDESVEIDGEHLFILDNGDTATVRDGLCVLIERDGGIGVYFVRGGDE